MTAYFFDCAVNSGIALLILFTGYRIFLCRNSNFAWSRATLLAIYLLAAVLPSLHFIQVPGQTAVIENAGVEIGELAAVKSSGTVLNSVISLLVPIYYIGISVAVIAIFAGWIKIAAIIWRGIKIQKDGYTLVGSAKRGISPFSVGRFIVVPNDDIACDAIITHELSHVRRLHFIDLLVAQAYLIFQWWNPAAWWMFRSLKTVHEYQADNDTLSSGVARGEYQTLIVTRCAGLTSNLHADTLGSGSLRARLRMMNRSNRKSSLFAFLILLPCAALASAVPTLTYAKDLRNAGDIEELCVSETEDDVAIIYVSETEPSEKETPTYSVNAYLTGENLHELLKNKIKYPYGKTDASGRVVVQFTLAADGRTKDVNILRSSGVPALDNEAMRAISELSLSSPITATACGKDITPDIRFSIPISFNP